MKRPLLLLAVVFVFGIWIFEDREAGTFFAGRIMPPDLRIRMEEDERRASRGGSFTEETYEGVLRGTIVWCFEREEKTLAVLETGDPGIGQVRVYVEEPFSENALAPGDTAAFEGRFFLFARADNPGEFDTRAYYDRLGSYLGFSAESCRIERPGRSPKRPVFRLLKYCVKTIDEHAEASEKGLFKAVLTGNQNLLPQDVRDVYEDAGVLYLLSASGFLVSALGGALFEGLRRRTGRKGLSILVSSLLMGVLVIFTGSTVSMLRAMVIYTLRILAPVFKRRFDLLSAASLAFILLLWERPGLLHVGAMQYYMAVLIAFGVLSPAVRAWLFRPHPFYTGAVRILAVRICLLPVEILTSYRTSLYALPLMLLFFGIRALTWCFTALASLTGIGALFDALGGVFYAERFLFERLLQLPGAVIVTGKPDVWRTAVYFGAVFALALFFRILHVRRKSVPEEKEHRITVRDHRLAAGALVCLYVFGMLFLRAPAMPRGTAAVDVLYVGQGDGILVRTRDKAYLIDGGSTSDDEIGRNVLLPALYRYGIRRLDGIFLTHDDLDHTSGVRYLLENGTVSVGKIYVAASALEKGDYAWVPADSCVPVSSGFSEGPFTVLWPEEDCMFEGNDASLVLSAAFPGGNALFTGDITEEAEPFLSLPHAFDLLKVAHHGSRYSSTEAFLADARPQLAVVSYGRRNPYGHPAEEACARITETGAVLYRTGEAGCVTVTFRPDGRIMAKPFHSVSLP